MQNPRITYKNNLKRSSQISKTFNNDFKDIYIFGRKEKGGLNQFNEEEHIKDLGKFIPGKIYTYRYDPLYKDVLDWYDTRPIIMVQGTYFAKGTNNWILQGINFNFLPPEATALTLEKFWENFRSEIEKSEIYASNDMIFKAINKILFFFSRWKDVLKVFDSGSGVDYSFAYRNYIIDRIQDLRYVEYNHWEMLPFLQPKEIIGESLTNIYKLYNESRGS